MAKLISGTGSGTGSGPRIGIGQFSTAGAKARNDDSYGIVVPASALLASHGIAMAIADGMSTSEGAKEASENCIKSFLEDYYCTHASWSVKKSAGVVLRAMNSWLYAQGQRQHLSERGMVSTFSGAILKAGTLHIFHAGDSRISRLRDGRIEALTRDHRARVGRGHQQLTRAFGIEPNVEVDYRSVPLETGDILLFTTDGVHDHVSPAEMIELLRPPDPKLGGDDLAGAAERVTARALERGSTDNLTCQIVRVETPGHPDEAGHLQALAALPFPPELAPGMTFDGYAIVRELHTSNRTQVYLARDIASGEMAVLKTPSVNFEDNPAYIEMFAREEWVGKLAAGPHVLKVIVAERPRRHLYITTEYFEGQTLRQWMRDHPNPDFETARNIVEQIAKGLRSFHRKDIIHQDLKPENVMIDPHGLMKIIDFGSARAAGLDEVAVPMQRPHLAGTIDYTAPEYHLGETPTNRADIYALGVVAYELLTGHLPYGRGFASARDVTRLGYIPASQWRDDVPVWMDAALEHAVRIQPEQRTDALSALVENLARPNTSLGYDRPKPLIERHPAAFWKSLALIELAVIVALLALWVR